MKILGIDPGTTRTGYGLIEKSKGVRLVECGLISGEGASLEGRLIILEAELTKIIKRLKPDLVCLEKLFFTKNKKTASSVSEARGVILLVIGQLGIKFLEFTPSEIKASVAGDGRADKKGVAKAVCFALGESSIPGPDDVSDALAIALMGSFERGLRVGPHT